MKIRHTILLMLCVLLSAACEVLDLPDAEVEVGDIEMQLSASAATITAAFESDVTIHSVCILYSTKSDLSEPKEASMTSRGNRYSVSLSNLQSNTKYYFRFKVANAFSYIYTEETKSFTTQSGNSGSNEDDDDDDDKAITLPTVTTAAVTQITETSAVAGGNVTSDGNAEVTERGIVYSTNPNPTISNIYNTIRPCGSGTGSFTYDITGLQPNTTYYLRAYAKNEKGTAYGEEVSFMTISNTGNENGYEWVNLGLSVKWATMNVGATKVEDYGDHFAWGETEPKATYDWSTYKWCEGSLSTLTKYNTNNNQGTVDNKTELELSDDAAHANWGGNWRMPTYAEWTELCTKCTWTTTGINGVNVYQVTSKSNGNSIFLPVAGIRYGSDHNNAGSDGHYWSSSLYTDYPNYAWDLFIYHAEVNRDSRPRYGGQSVRPVCP